MTDTPSEQTKAKHNIWLFRYAFSALSATIILLYTGGFTTTIRAGMVFLDWPLSNGSLNPDGWLSNTAMLAEHSHRLTGMTVGILITILMIWVLLKEQRIWIRRLAIGAFVLVLVQGLLGGARVLLNSVPFAIVHGCIAQSFLCLLITIVCGLSPTWKNGNNLNLSESDKLSRTRNFGYLLILITVIQLIVAATMRHLEAGLSIPTFPLNPDGTLIPGIWSPPIAIHFTHRAIALVLTVMFIVWGISLYRSHKLPSTILTFIYLSWGSLLFQILLGASVIWMERPPVLTTLHMLNGALFLGFIWTTNLLLHHRKIEETHHNHPEYSPSRHTPTVTSQSTTT